MKLTLKQKREIVEGCGLAVWNSFRTVAPSESVCQKIAANVLVEFIRGKFKLKPRRRK